MGTKLKCQSGGEKKRPCGQGFYYNIYPEVEDSSHIEERAIHTGSIEGNLVGRREGLMAYWSNIGVNSRVSVYGEDKEE